MKYQKLTAEIIVFPEDADAVMAALNSAIDQIGEAHAIFGGEIETTTIEHSGMHRKSALKHAMDAGNTATSAVRSAAQKLTSAYKRVV